MEQIPSIIHESWHSHLQPLFDDPKMLMLKNDILPKCKFYPKGEDIFRVFSMPLNEITVVALGQDPYFNGEATGLAFAVHNSNAMPPSLKIIKAEVANNGFKPDENIRWRTFEHLHQQGVFLLNTGLTVEAKNAGSHLGYWQWFTREVIKVIATHAFPIWLLWGAKAKGFADYITPKLYYGESIFENMPKTGMNYILTSDHPQAENYNGGTSKDKFSGTKHFIKVNEILKAKGQKQIIW